MTTVIAFIIILSILIFVHELGHFVVAKRSGITVEEFAIGFPPRMAKVWQDKGSITLDGKDYIIGRKVRVSRSIQPGTKVYAETTVDSDGQPAIEYIDLVATPDSEDKKETEQPVASGGSEAKFFGMFSRDSGKSNDENSERPNMTVDTLVRPTEYSINWIPLGGYVRMVGEEDATDPGSFASKSKSVRLAVLAAGSFMNLVLAVFLFMFTSMSGVPEPVLGVNAMGEEAPIAQTIVTDVVENTPAEDAGLESGDIILGADDVDFAYMGDLITYVNDNKGSEIVLHVDRESELFDVPIVPRVNPPEGQGSMGIGITYDGETNKVYYPPHTAFVKGVEQTGEYIGLVFYMPIAIIRDVIPAEAARPTGPVGIYQQTSSAVDAAITLDWWFPILWLTAILSTALAVTNLLPLPALDGGRILFILIEAVRGKRISPEKEGAIHFIGLALLLTLMLVISYYDVSDPIPAIPWTDIF